MHQLIKENLDRRFSALLTQKGNSFHFLSMEWDYILYLGKGKKVAEIIESLVIEGKVTKEFMIMLCGVFVVAVNQNLFLTRSKTELKTGSPLFWTKKVEDKFQLNAEFKQFIKRLEAEEKNPVPNLNKYNVEIDLHGLQKLHNDIMERLSGEVGELRFVSSSSELFFQNKPIRISRNKNTQMHLLIDIIFIDRYKIWNYDEIAEKLDREYNAEDWEKYWQLAYQINGKVAKATTILDLFLMDKFMIKINPKYLP